MCGVCGLLAPRCWWAGGRVRLQLAASSLGSLAAVLGLGLATRDLVTWRRELEVTSLAWRHLPFTLAYSEQVAGAGNVVFTPE